MKKLKNQIENLPEKPGVYMFKNSDGEVLYVGKSINLRSRAKSYLNPNDKNSDKKIREMVNRAEKITYIETESDFDALILEAYLIKTLKPSYNNRLKDDKRYLYIKITNEKYPRVLTARRTDLENAHYFGPYPSARTVKEVLNMLRRVFPYCTQKPNSKRKCFYSHINLCNPCPALIKREKPETKKKLYKKYKQNIKNLILMLKGERKKLQKDLRMKMEKFSENMQYEEAEEIKKQLFKLEYIVSRNTNSVKKYLQDFNNEGFSLLRTEKARKLLLSYFPDIKQLKRIEGYDISNINGKYATGSMVVFRFGDSDKKEYRKFKIQGIDSPDDPAMLAEVLERRLNHIEWDYPDLIIVDGGKTQLSAVNNIIKQKNIKIPLIALAKKEEQVFIKNGERFKNIKLPRKSPALQLFMEVRDEAHRFAREYHKKLRNKQSLK